MTFWGGNMKKETKPVKPTSPLGIITIFFSTSLLPVFFLAYSNFWKIPIQELKLKCEALVEAELKPDQDWIVLYLTFIGGSGRTVGTEEIDKSMRHKGNYVVINAYNSKIRKRWTASCTNGWKGIILDGRWREY